MSTAGESYFIVGGAGFIGSHFTDRLLASDRTRRVTLYDNFTSGRAWHFEDHVRDRRLEVVRGDVHEFARLRDALAGHDTVIHLAANPESARAARGPEIDFREGTELTHLVVEAMRQTGARRIVYASAGGVYGETGGAEAREDNGPIMPVSTGGASKLAGEALIASYAHTFDLRACALRFDNAVGRRQTHGTGFDFVRRLRKDPTRLRIRGDGRQSKSYVHVEDVVSAALLAQENSTRPFEAFNVASGDFVTVKEVADLACGCLGLDPARVRYEYTAEDRGSKGDTLAPRLNTEKVRGLGWRPTRTSAQALREAMLALLADLKAGRDEAGSTIIVPLTRAGDARGR